LALSLEADLLVSGPTTTEQNLSDADYAFALSLENELSLVHELPPSNDLPPNETPCVFPKRFVRCKNAVNASVSQLKEVGCAFSYDLRLF